MNEYIRGSDGMILMEKPKYSETPVLLLQCGAKRTHVLQIIVTLFIFNIKNVNTKTTCNKCSFDYLH